MITEMIPNMNLAFCLFNYFPYGGLQRDFLRIAQECVQRGHQVDVYTMRWEGERDPQLNIIILPPIGLQNHSRRKNFVKQLRTELNKKSYDLIVGFNKMPGLDVYYAADTCFQAKARKQHGALYRLTSRYRQSVAFEKAVFSADSPTEILLISKPQQAEFEHFYKTQSKRFHLLPPGISKDRMAPANAEEIRTQLRNEFNLTNDTILLLMVGSGFKTKGLDRTLIGMANLPENLRKRAILFILGQDNAEPFQKQAKQLGIGNQIKFLGGRDDVPRFLLAADLLLHPAYNENTGTILLEALVSGLPVLTTDVCGYADYIRQANAGIVLPSPYQQSQFNKTLTGMLLSTQLSVWKRDALAFSQHADIYSLPVRAVDFIESLGK